MTEASVTDEVVVASTDLMMFTLGEGSRESLSLIWTHLSLDSRRDVLVLRTFLRDSGLIATANHEVRINMLNHWREVLASEGVYHAHEDAELCAFVITTQN